MANLNKYVLYVIIGALVLALLSAGIFGYMWGKERAETKSLREEKREYLEVKHEQDSIVKEMQDRIIFVTDSMNTLVKEGVAIDKTTDKSRVFVKEDKKKMHEEINSVPDLSVADQLKLFARQSEEYKPRP